MFKETRIITFIYLDIAEVELAVFLKGEELGGVHSIYRSSKREETVT